MAHEPRLLPQEVRCHTSQGLILAAMSRVARQLREESRERMLRMTPGERLTEALRLGQRAIGAYAAAHGLERDAARRELERAAQAGRRYSRVMRDLAG
jgi:hypothetical protein